MGSAGAGMSGPGKAKTVWITRTDSGAAGSAKAVKRAGFAPLIAPLLKLSAVSTPGATPDDDSVLAFTSPNAVLAFQALSDRRIWPVYAVGDATADAARGAGFEFVHSAGGNVDDLAALKAAHTLCKLLPAAFGPLVHCIAISPNVDTVLGAAEHEFASRQIAASPNEPAMTALLEAVTLKA